jgi:HD superfamily phosphohydrolase
MDTPQFQRLRELKQLGATYFVFPGASHNRFEHSLGVCHLAGQMVDRIRRVESQKKDGIVVTQQDTTLVRVAGLCHDIAHGPFSHVFEHEFMPRAKPHMYGFFLFS